MLTLKYIIFILFYLNIIIVFGHNGFRVKTSSGKLRNVNLETLLDLHKDVSGGRIFNNDGTYREAPEKNTTLSKLIFLTDVINEILNEGLSDQENEILSNIISIHGEDKESKFNEKNMTEDLLGLVFNNIMHNKSHIPDNESDDVNKGEESVEEKINAYLLSDETNNNQLATHKNLYFIRKEKDEIKEEAPIGLNPDFKPMENKWKMLLNESLRLMEFGNKKDLRTVKPVFDDILNKKFRLNRSLVRKSTNKVNTANKKSDKRYPKLKSLSKNTEKSVNIKVSNIDNELDDDNYDNITIDMFSDVNATESSLVGPSYRRQLKISANKIKDYRKNVQGLKKLKERSSRQERRNYVELDPNYNEDDYYWEPSPLLSRRIYQGIPVRITDFPFMASIHMFEILQCSGSIIKSDLILTAASCLQIAWNNRFFRENPRFLTVRVGSTRFFGGGEVIEVAEVYFHPLYKPKTLTANLAIIRLYRNLRFSNATVRYVVKIRYDRNAHRIPDNYNPVTLVGFGAVRASNRLHAKGFGKLQYAILPIYPWSNCRDMYTKEYVTKYNFCAGLMDQGSGACNHDVGDPGISEGVILGIVSFGSPICGRTDTPTVFTKVGQFKPWIDEIYKIEPVVYQHRFSTTPIPIPLEPIDPVTKPKPKINGTKAQRQRDEASGNVKLSNNGKTRRPFKLRPVTKSLNILEYFPADDPSKMGNTKKRKLRLRPQSNKEITQRGQMQEPGVANSQQKLKPPFATSSLPYGMYKLPFGMAQPPLAVARKLPFGMQQPPPVQQQQQSPALQQQQQSPEALQVQSPAAMQVQSEAAMQAQAGENMQMDYGAAMQQQEGSENMVQFAAAIAQLQMNEQTEQPSAGNQPHLTTGSLDIAREPALTQDFIQTDGTTTQRKHEFLPDICNDSDLEGTGPKAEKCSISAAAAAMSVTVTSAGDIKPQVDKEFDGNNAVDIQVRGQQLTANSNAIDHESKVSSIIESIIDPGIKADMRKSPDADKHQDGAQTLNEMDKSILSMPYATDKEDKTKEDKNNAEHNDSGFKDYNVPRGEGLALPDEVDVIELDEPNEYRFRASDVRDENPNYNNPTDQAVGNAYNTADQRIGDVNNHSDQDIRTAYNTGNQAIGNAYDTADQGIGNAYSTADQGDVNNPSDQPIRKAFNTGDQATSGEGDGNINFGAGIRGLFGPDQIGPDSGDPGDEMADVITNIPRYREDTDPPEDYLDGVHFLPI